MPQIDLTYPFGGLSENVSFTDQPPNTTRDELNMRGLDPVTGRMRGGQRGGFTLFSTTAMNGTHSIRDLNFVVVDDKKNTYTELSSSSDVVDDGTDGTFLKDVQDVVWSMKTDSVGDVYMLVGDNGATTSSVQKRNSSGNLLHEINIPLDSCVASQLVVDSVRNIFVGTTNLSGTQANARLFKYEIQADESYDLVYSYEVKTQANNIGTTGFPTALFMRADVLYVGLWDDTNHRAEIHRYDSASVSSVAPSGPDVAFEVTNGAAAPNEQLDATHDYPPYGLVARGDGSIIVVTHEGSAAITDTQWILKFDAQGTYVFDQNTTADSISGYGQCIALDSNDNYYTSGSEYDNSVEGGTSDTGWLIHWTDSGSTFAPTSASSTWPIDNAAADWTVTEAQFRNLAVDQDNNVYAPFSKDGTAGIHIYDTGGSTAPGVLLTYLEADGCIARPLTVALQPAAARPNYGDEDIANGGGVTLDEFVYYGAFNTSSNNFAKIRIVTVAVATGSQRTQVLAGVNQGDVVKFTNSGAGTVPNGGTNIFDTGSDHIQSVAHFGKLYYTDGKNIAVYDPADKSTSAAGEVSVFTSTVSGEIPQRCKLIASWRGRLVLARPAGDGHNWFMSAVDEPGNFNFFPQIITSSIAVAGNSSDVGRVPDIINTLIPWSDDLMFFGCDHSIWRLTGDPMDGGQIDQIPTDYGIAFGKPWTEGPHGEVYFFSSRGGLHVMSPTGERQRVSLNTIERRLTDIDLSTHHVRLAWDYRSEGLHIFLIERGVLTGQIASGQTTHYFWEQKTNSFHPDKFTLVAGSPDLEPGSVMVIDGDAPADRKLMIGCDDGFVRKYDDTATADKNSSDVDLAIDSFVTMGPFRVGAVPGDLRFNAFEFVLSDNQSGCHFELFATERPDVIGAVQGGGTLIQGVNPIFHDRLRGRFLFVRLRDASTGRWAYEYGRCQAALAGRVRAV